MRKLIGALVFVMLNMGLLFAQDAHISSNDLFANYLSPAHQGIAGERFGASVLYRNQWKSVGIPFNLYGANVYGQIHNGNGVSVNLSGVLTNQTVLALNKMQASLSLSSSVRLNTKNFLTAGLSGGYVSQSVNSDVLQWSSQYTGAAFDPLLPSQEQVFIDNKGAFDIGAGLGYKYNDGIIRNHEGKQLIAAVGLWHINEPKQYFISDNNPLHKRLNAYILGFLPVNSKLALNSGLFLMQQHGFNEFFGFAGLRIRLKDIFNNDSEANFTAISASLGYRYKDALIAGLNFEREKIILGLIYDRNISAFKAATNGFGALEICMKYSINQ